MRSEEDQVDQAAVDTAAERNYQDRIRELELQLQDARAKQAEAAGEKPPPDTHVQVLTCGHSYHTPAPVATLHTCSVCGSLSAVINTYPIPQEV